MATISENRFFAMAGHVIFFLFLERTGFFRRWAAVVPLSTNDDRLRWRMKMKENKNRKDETINADFDFAGKIFDK